MNTRPTPPESREPTEAERELIQYCGDYMPHEFHAVLFAIRAHITTALASRDAEIARLKAEIATDSWSREMQEALQAIPTQFVQNDYWVNGIKRMASALSSALAACEAKHSALQDFLDFSEGGCSVSLEDVYRDKARRALALTPAPVACEEYGWLKKQGWFHDGEGNYTIEFQAPIAENPRDAIKAALAIKPAPVADNAREGKT